MKRFVFAAILTLILGFSTLSNAALQDNGNGLIYDTDRNITWYDYTKSADTWFNQKTWAANLSVTDVNGTTITGWRLPTTVDGQGVVGYNGTTTAGYNITTSEMGHLYYTELGNKGYYDVNGNSPQPGWGLNNTGPFTNLLPSAYWSGTEYALLAGGAWLFYFGDGVQDGGLEGYGLYALAVHSGDVGAPVPIPGAILLFAPGLVGLAAVRRRLKK